MKISEILNRAIRACDSRFYGENATKHIRKHAKEMGLTRKGYLAEGEKLSLSPANKLNQGGIEGFKDT